MAPGPEHGDDLPAERARALRAPPPDETLAWAAGVCGDVVTQVEALRGGSSSAMHVLWLGDGNERVVLRRYVVPLGDDDIEAMVEQEAAGLRLLDGVDVPTPALLAADPRAEGADAPALLMTHVEGSVLWQPSDRRAWCGQQVEALLAINEVVVPDAIGIPAYDPWRQRSDEPPRWARDRSVWVRAIERFDGPVPDGDALIHRDFWPGNVLWRRGRLTGVVDWQHVSAGPPVADIGHARMNLLFADVGLADQLLDAWERLSGSPYDRWADVAAIIGVLDGLRSSPPAARVRDALEAALAAAV